MSDEVMECCEEKKECCKTKVRDADEKKSLMNRLNRIEGQVRGIRGMVERDVYCTDILIQVSAINAALHAFSRKLLDNHIKTCVVNDIKSDKMETVDELLDTLQRIMK